MATPVSFKSLPAEDLQDPEFAAELHRTRQALEFALSLTRLREARGLTPRDLEARTGIKQPMGTRMGKGQIPSTPTLQKLAQALDAQARILADGRITIEASAARAEAA